MKRELGVWLYVVAVLGGYLILCAISIWLGHRQAKRTANIVEGIKMVLRRRR